MTAFAFTPVVSSPHADIISACLGVDAATKLSDLDINKPVKLAGADNYVLCAAGDEIEGFVVNTEAPTKNDGFAFGSVQRNKRVQAKVVTLGVVVRDLVVAGAPSAIGTADALMLVQKAAGTEAKLFNWRVLSIVTGTGAVGDTVLIEKI